MSKSTTEEDIGMKDPRKAEEIAAQRVQLLAPLFQEGLDAAQQRQLRQQIMQQTGLSERTLRRYLAQYRAEGYQGLVPKARKSQPAAATIPEEVLQQAILLRREVPGRSVSTIIDILEMEQLALPGQIKRTTLQERLAENGYSARHMKMYQSSGTAARRFQRRNRNSLWHADIKYGPFLPIGRNDELKQVYLVAFLDDATRYILHAEFYPTLDSVIVQKCFRQAVSKFGLPDAVYFDNGKQFRNKWMERACAKLAVRLLFARPYSPEGTGKIERFNRTVDQFLPEGRLQSPKTVDALNHLFQIWLEECYQNRPHSALGEEGKRISPYQAFQKDTKPLRFLEPDVVANAFLHCENRKVDKSGCINFAGKKYEAGLSFVGSTIQVVYDPEDTSVLTLECVGHEPWLAKELVIGQKTGPRPKLPERMTPQPATRSRLLDAVEKKHTARQQRQYKAVSYRGIGGGSHV
jgi:transposase InsO family protein